MNNDNITHDNDETPTQTNVISLFSPELHRQRRTSDRSRGRYDEGERDEIARQASIARSKSRHPSNLNRGAS